MSQMPFSGTSGFPPPVQSPDCYETKSIFAFRVKLKGSFLHFKLTNKTCRREVRGMRQQCNSHFQVHLMVSESNNSKEKWKFGSNP